MSDLETLRFVRNAFRDSLPASGYVSVFRIDKLDRIGVPVVQANLILPDEPATIGYGYGFDALEAEVGALGELCEEVHVGLWIKQAPSVIASYAKLVRTHGAKSVVDPLTLCLPAGSPYSPELLLSWINAERWPSGEAVMVPREWVAAYPYQLGRPAQLITPITNGLGAGLSLPHAVAHGLMELLQRDGNALNFRALDQGVVVHPDAVDEPGVVALLGRLKALGIDIRIKLAGTDFNIANLYVVGDDQGNPAIPIQVTSCGEAAHPDRARGLRKALLEFCGSRSRKASTHGPIDLIRNVLPDDYIERQINVALLEEEENRALEAMAEWLGQDAKELHRRLSNSVFSENRHVRLSDLPTVPVSEMSDAAGRLDLVVSRLTAEGLEPIVVDCSPPGSPVKVVKTIVPGLESETMSYHRIGWRGVRRLRERDDKLLLSGPRSGALRVRLRPQDERLAGGPAWLDVKLADQIVGQLYPLYRESGPFSAQLLRQRRAA